VMGFYIYIITIPQYLYGKRKTNLFKLAIRTSSVGKCLNNGGTEGSKRTYRHKSVATSCARSTGQTGLDLLKASHTAPGFGRRNRKGLWTMGVQVWAPRSPRLCCCSRLPGIAGAEIVHLLPSDVGPACPREL
jgi:hypothetical protein